MGNVWFLAKALAIYSGKKTKFDSMNIDKSSKLAYFWLIDSKFYFLF